jgi:CheY-like chemotaxis protein
MATIVIADDKGSNRQFLATLLGYFGHRVLEAEDGAQALALARSERPDLVFTDVLMPQMDGLELARRIRGDPAVAGVPIIFYTAPYRGSGFKKLAQDLGSTRSSPNRRSRKPSSTRSGGHWERHSRSFRRTRRSV